MKISTSKSEQFTPVTVELLCETQLELNALYAIGNTSRTTRDIILVGGCNKSTNIHSLNAICDALYTTLRPFKG
jgi:hypothetical protein